MSSVIKNKVILVVITAALLTSIIISAAAFAEWPFVFGGYTKNYTQTIVLSPKYYIAGVTFKCGVPIVTGYRADGSPIFKKAILYTSMVDRGSITQQNIRLKFYDGSEAVFAWNQPNQEKKYFNILGIDHDKTDIYLYNQKGEYMGSEERLIIKLTPKVKD